MAWLGASILAVAVLYFAIHYSGFRRTLLIVFVCIVALSAIGGGIAYWISERDAAQLAYAKTLIRGGDIDFIEMLMTPGYSHESREVTGKVRNRSAYPLKSFRLKIVVRDCSAGQCEIIGEDEVWAYSADVPAGQVRAFSANASFQGIPAAASEEWSYSVSELEADLR